MNVNEIQVYIEENFVVDGGCAKIINNILWYIEGHTSDEKYKFFSEMLQGIGLTDKEIKKFAGVK